MKCSICFSAWAGEHELLLLAIVAHNFQPHAFDLAPEPLPGRIGGSSSCTGNILPFESCGSEHPRETRGRSQKPDYSFDIKLKVESVNGVRGWKKIGQLVRAPYRFHTTNLCHVATECSAECNGKQAGDALTKGHGSALVKIARNLKHRLFKKSSGF